MNPPLQEVFFLTKKSFNMTKIYTLLPLSHAFSLIVNILLVSTTVRAQQGTVLSSQIFKSAILKQGMKYNIYLPNGYQTSQKRYPVLYLLHGYSGSELDWVKIGKADSIANKLTEAKAIPEMIIVMPDGRNDYYLNTFDGKFRYEDYFIKELVPFVDSTFRTKTDRASRAIAGLSMGGYGAALYGLKYPEKFAVVAGMSSAIRTDAAMVALSDSLFDSRYEGKLGLKLRGQNKVNDYYQKNSVLKLMETEAISSLKDTRWYFDCGDDDFLTEGNCALHVLMNKRKIPHEFRVRDGAHDWTYWRTALPDVLKFVAFSFK
jgi:enterochelin esterase-like enzyme